MATRRKKRGKGRTPSKAAPSKRRTPSKAASGKGRTASKAAPRGGTSQRARRAKATQRKTPPARARRRSVRLSPHVRPTEVDLHVEVDPSVGPGFEGEVTHHLSIARTTRSFEIHAADLRVSRARIEVDGRRIRATLEPDPERQTLVVRPAEPLLPGTATLSLAFRGRLRKDLRGLYAASSGERAYAFTQLEAADARRFFPCFDEPSFKAAFALSVTTGRGNTVLSNSPSAKIEPLDGGRKRVHFERTPLLSTYLLALAVGELEASEPRFCGKTEIRVWHVPGKGGLNDFGLETARETLSRLEAYFDLPYPYEKLDLVAVPDFEAGAMENAGAVFFRETLLLVDPETATLQEKKRVAEVICHELAHMWYGDLVTMAWWDDLWLNEAFATWMAFQVVDGWKPEWKMWNDFQHYRSAALGMDALAQTHPIYTKVRTPEEATENFDLITYEKGASVVRMIERYLGAETFRAGVRCYIRDHQLGNTVAADLWDALGEASGQEVEPIVRAWIEQPGFPLVRITRKSRDGGTELTVRQERFRSKGGRARAGGRESWPIPWVGRIGTGRTRSRTERALLTKKRQVLTLPVAKPRFVYGNADEGGFFRPLHAPEELAAIAGSLDALSAVERMGLLGHQWAAVRSLFADVGPLLDLALAFGEETDADVLLTLAAPLDGLCGTARRALVDGADAILRGQIVDAFGPALQAAGFDRGDPDDTDTSLRRAALLTLVGQVGEDPTLVPRIAELCDAYLDDRRSIDPNLADGIVSQAARSGDGERFERFLAQAERAATPQERRRFLMALGSFREPALIKRTLELCLTDTILTQDVAILLTRMLGNRAAGEATWAFMKRRWKALVRRLPPMMVTRPIEATPALGTREYRRDVAEFFEAHPVATGERAVRQALEQFDLDLAFDRKVGPALQRWLAQRADLEPGKRRG